jgi:hypothetical protein
VGEGIAITAWRIKGEWVDQFIVCLPVFCESVVYGDHVMSQSMSMSKKRERVDREPNGVVFHLCKKNE